MSIKDKCFMNVEIREIPQVIASEIADIVEETIREKNSKGGYAVIGLPTGDSYLPFYEELVRRNIDFSKVKFFNIDELYPIQPSNPNSYYSYLRKNFFDKVKVPEENIHLIDGSEKTDVKRYCKEYEETIKEAGGFDLILLGLGKNGHIANLEPGAPIESRTMLYDLDETTRKHHAEQFGGIENVPTQSITLGAQTILESKKIIIAATGYSKASLIPPLVYGPHSDQITASYLQTHKYRDVTLFIDGPAASQIKKK